MLQELRGLLLAHFAIRQLMAQAAWPRGLDPDALSFVHAVRVIKRKLPRAAAVPPERLASWRDALLAEIARARCVSSRGRFNPRGVRRKMSNFTSAIEASRCTNAISRSRFFLSEQY